VNIFAYKKINDDDILSLGSKIVCEMMNFTHKGGLKSGL
jgi:hypothetical protein